MSPGLVGADTGATVGPGDDAAPGLWRRMACFIYEGVLLFGVVMIAGYLFSTLTQQRNALNGRHGLQAFLFIVLGIYFVWFWSRGGQTVAMKRLAHPGGRCSRVQRCQPSHAHFCPVPAELAVVHAGADTGDLARRA